MKNQNIARHLPREQVIDKTVFRITRAFTQQRSPETALIRYIKNTQIYKTKYKD